MPNEKVRYFKKNKIIKEKIVYVKDKDILGHESSNSLAFQYRYWKLKQFGISNNVIIMDDDYFIGNKLEKSDFFYVENRKVIPLIVTSNFLQIDKKTIQKKCELYKIKSKMSKEEQNSVIFDYSNYLAIEFVLNIFNIPSNKSIYIPKFTHNATPINLMELKNIYDIIVSSKYKYTTLDCLFRHIQNVQFHTFFLSYIFLKFDRKVKNIPAKIIKINNSISSDYNFDLFCINKGPGNYSYLNLFKAKITMEHLFPIPSPYEIIDYPFINVSFNVVYYQDEIIKNNENQMSLMIAKKDCFNILIKCFFLFVLIICKIKKIQ